MQARCPAPTKQGKACRSLVADGRTHCLMHDPEMQDLVEAARRRGGTAAAKTRALQGKRLRLDSAAALLRFNSDLLQDTLGGFIDPAISRAVSYAVANQLRMLQAAGLDERLTALEQRLSQAEQGRQRWVA